MQSTSLEIYHKLLATGFFKGIRLKILGTFAEYGEQTQAEVARRMPEYQQRSITPRFAELLKMEVIREVGERPCEVTKNKAKVWGLVEQVPLFLHRPKKHASEKARLLFRIKELEKENEILRQRLQSPSFAGRALVAKRYAPKEHAELFSDRQEHFF